MVKRKSVIGEKEDKPKVNVPDPRRLGRRFDFDALDNTFENGSFLPQKGDEVFFERLKESKPTICVGTVVTLYEDGTVHIWDDTYQEFFCFNAKKEESKVKVRWNKK
jgi:hypothetical protein